MERTGQTSTLKKTLTPQSVLEEGLRWENFEPSNISLTKEEEEFALRVALDKKVAEIKEILWHEKVNRKKELMSKLDPSQVLHIAAKTVCGDVPGLNIGDFVLSEEFEIYDLLAHYFSNSEKFEYVTVGEGEYYSLNKGIFLFGKVGCGKTTAMNSFRMIATVTFPMISCNKIANEYKKEGVEAIDKYINLPAICFDDLGTEASSKHFGDEKNVMAEIILGRYEKERATGFKTHLTTNLSADEIEQYYGPRVRSRMREMFNQIAFPEKYKDKRK